MYGDMRYTANMDSSRLICTHSSSYWKRTQNSHWFHLLKNSILLLSFAPTIIGKKSEEKFKWLHFFMFTIHYESQSLLYVCASIIDWWKIHNDRDDQVWQEQQQKHPIKGMEKKFNNPFFHQCPFNICQKLPPRFNDLKNSHLLNF